MLSPYRKHFPPEQQLIETTEDFAENPEAMIRRCLEHIGADPEREIDGAEVHTNNAAAKSIQHPLIAKLRSNGIVGLSQMEWLYHRRPDWLWSIGKRMLTREGEFQPEWDPVLRAEVIERIRPDAEKLLASIDKPLDYWWF